MADEVLRAGSARPRVSRVERIAEAFPAMLARLNNQQRADDIVHGLIPANGISMIHGQPRALKTWSAMEIARACATQDAAFGLERFRVRSPLLTWYLTEEDPELVVRDRFASLFAGRNQSPPDALHVSVHNGIDLDDGEWQARMTQYARRHAVRLTVLDPLRTFSAAVDQGPREVKPLVRFLRQYMRDTGSALLLVHHDVKVLNGKNDERDRPQRMSGGGIFSATDAPIHAELLDKLGSRTLLTPARYKFSTAPEPFIVTIESDDARRPTWVRIQGSESTTQDAAELQLRDRIKEFLLHNVGATGSRIAVGIKADKGRVLTALNQMLSASDVVFVPKGQAKHWSIADRKTDIRPAVADR